jgi:hypothetical protein
VRLEICNLSEVEFALMGKMIALCDALLVAKEGGEAGRQKDKE